MCEIHTFGKGDFDLFNFIEMGDSKYREKSSKRNTKSAVTQGRKLFMCQLSIYSHNYCNSLACVNDELRIQQY